MKKFFFFLLAITLLFSAVSCGGEDLSSLNAESETKATAETPPPAAAPMTSVEKVTKEINYPEVPNPLQPEDLAALPIANASMSTDELRKLCLDYFNLQLSFQWTPDEKFKYTIESSDTPVSLGTGKVYGGLPYVTVGTGNLYRVLECYDTETGVMPVSLFQNDPKLFGNQCSVGAFWGWGRVINSAQYNWTQNMVKSRGFIPVGTYTYPDDLKRYAGSEEGAMTTNEICQKNGREVMWESYAKLQPADGLVQFKTKGHVIMCLEAPNVVYDASGKVDGLRSTLKFRDQTSKWVSGTMSNGRGIEYQGRRSTSLTFQELYTNGYLPFTFGELIGTDPVEPSSVALTFSDAAPEGTVTVEQLRSATLNSNYSISDVFLIVYDGNGAEQYRFVKRSTSANVREVSISDLARAGALEDYCDGNHKVEISAQISTGEKPTVYSAALTK